LNLKLEKDNLKKVCPITIQTAINPVIEINAKFNSNIFRGNIEA